jgi:hypothetical protein
MLGLMFFVLGILFGVGTATAAARWIMRPIDEAATDRQHPAQFSLADFLCLFFLLQLSMGLVHWAFPSETAAVVWFLDAFVWFLDACAWFALTSLWWAGVRRLSRAGIRNPWIRCAFLTVAIPFALAVMLILPFGTIVFLLGGGIALTGQGPGIDSETFFTLGLATASAAAVAYALGLSTRWMVRRYGAAAEPSTTPPSESVAVSLESATESAADDQA